MKLRKVYLQYCGEQGTALLTLLKGTYQPRIAVVSLTFFLGNYLR